MAISSFQLLRPKPWSYLWLLSVSLRIQCVSKCYWLSLQNVSRIQPLLTTSTTSTLVQITIIFSLDSCESFQLDSLLHPMLLLSSLHSGSQSNPITTSVKSHLLFSKLCSSPLCPFHREEKPGSWQQPPGPCKMSDHHAPMSKFISPHLGHCQTRAPTSVMLFQQVHLGALALLVWLPGILFSQTTPDLFFHLLTSYLKSHISSRTNLNHSLKVQLPTPGMPYPFSVLLSLQHITTWQTIYLLMYLLIIFLAPLECKYHEGRNSFLLCSLLYLQHLAKTVAHSRYSINSSTVNE